MRLGGYFHAKTIQDLEPLCEQLDAYGLSAISAPSDLWNWSDEECSAYGEKARSLGIVIGEAGYWENLLDPDTEAVKNRIKRVRQLLRKADLMGVKCVVTLVGSKDGGSALAPHPYNFTPEAKTEFHDICMRIVDGLELKTTKYCIEPWCNSFFYEVDEVHDFLRMVNHPNVGLHMDQMNMVTHRNYYRMSTPELI